VFQRVHTACRLVTDTLKPLDGSRKCFHLVGGVLCERSVADVLPLIESTRSGVRGWVFLTVQRGLHDTCVRLLQIEDVLKNLNTQLKATNEERLHHQV
jgi:hypothetical protein